MKLQQAPPFGYDKLKHGHVIDWDRSSLKIKGQRVLLVGGEFHYWRIPDKERWEGILKAYKGGGLNCVRIYFHWGYHNPVEGKYVFDGNKDVDYLLGLCEKIGLYVFVASGPYICAETTAGGFPLWLLQHRDVRIRHMKGDLRFEYDGVFMKHAKDWLAQFIVRVKQHQLTENAKGCIVGYQIENEYGFTLIKGLRRYMAELAQHVRDCGITVPIFHNDAYESGSWNGLVDLYGFDKYPVFANKKARALKPSSWPVWMFKLLVDRSEQVVRGYKPPARDSPMFIPELQGGWYNHWTVKYSFDELYDYYGATYQKMLVESYAAQGTSIMVLYMYYGGTNHGAIGGAEVCTSYDYAGCLREFGFLADRGRHLRAFLLFANSFMPSIVEAVRVKPSIKTKPGGMLYRQRVAPDGTEFYYFRNFTGNKDEFAVTLADGTRVPKGGWHVLEPRDSLVAVGNHGAGDFTIKFCSMPVLVKATTARGTIMVVGRNGGELLLDGDGFKAAGGATLVEEAGFTRVQFASPGLATVSSRAGRILDIVCLSMEEALTCNTRFMEGESVITWGAHESYFTRENTVEIHALGKQRVHLFSSRNAEGFSDVDGSPFPGLKVAELGEDADDVDVDPSGWERMKIGPGQVSWKAIDRATQLDPIDHGFMCGHVIYKCTFNPGDAKDLSIKLNIRHKAAVWLNGKCVGGHHVYNLAALIDPFHPGSINGPDPLRLGGRNYNLSGAIKPGKENDLLVLVENLGHGKQFFMFDDCRIPRGILSVKFSKELASEKWFIAGIDVTKLDDAYSTSGLPGEREAVGGGKARWEPADELSLQPDDMVTWFRTSFSWSAPVGVSVPLRLHLEGSHNASIFLNGHLVGRYWGEQGPQHDFYLMEKYLRAENVLVLGCWTTTDDSFSAEIMPYLVKADSGNLDEGGILAATKEYRFSL
ncbi:MAG: beta-galactosidase [Candidatus Lokiarchaeota archaeon]|nr:beta-galactosidase [Candidatus Lokiarchaeota archaeon]